MRVAIVDDSRLARVELRSQLSQIEGIEIVAEAASVKAALDILAEHMIDLLLLDIDLPDGTGFDVLEQSNQTPQVIFVTAFNEYAIKSFEYNALDYLLKPVRQERLAVSISKVNAKKVSEKLSSDKRIFIKDRDKCFFVHLDEIFAFEAMGNYTRVYLSKGVPAVYRPISAIYDRLDQSVFFRASRSWIVNTNFIENIEILENNTFLVKMTNGKEVNISKRQAAEFKRIWSL
ncbi:LytR/AlgR family response regulator transcription factor [Agaribacter marinus]|uniref:DNA-binding response regulator n=1 Tax=Agaribacter marinus TaxID=1431249 RepID=A0AA37T431_9ALTE|nr:LytTR family DNA-binding domain-containing protein [Agaribacter marinus]GLR71753.1 DNA-binding response regulator [Agaribacter marinus]